MASQLLRRENKTDEREVHVEKDKVPKIASHFEAIAVKDTGDQPGVVHQVIATTMHGASGGIHDQSDKTQGQHKVTNIQGKQKEGGEYKGPSLDEISKYRGTAQQNSMEAILAAEEKYRNSKATMEKSQQTDQQAKEGLSNSNQTVEKGRKIGQQAKERLSGATQIAAENAARVSDFTVVKSQKAKEGLSSAVKTVTEKAARAKDNTLEKGQQTGQQAKESLSSAAQTAIEKAAIAKDYTLEKSVQAKDIIAEKTSRVTESAVDVTKRGAGNVGEKAVAAKDIALETGKTTVGYVGKVVGVVKDKAVVAGWSAVEFASDKAVGATE